MTVLFDGIKYPTPTNIIADTTDKPALVQWSANQAVEYLIENCTKTGDMYNVSESDLKAARYAYKTVSKRALDVGSAVHDAIRVWLLSGQEPVNPDDQVTAAFIAFLEFFDANQMETLITEERFFLKDWSGQYDWYGKFNGSLYIIDWKSSAGHYREHRIQTAAYRYALDVRKIPVNGHGVLRIDKETGLPDFKDYSKFYWEDCDEFLLSKRLYFKRHPRIAGQFEDEKIMIEKSYEKKAYAQLSNLMGQLEDLHVKGAKPLYNSIKKKRTFINMYVVDEKLCRLMVKEAKADLEKFSKR